MSSDKKTDTAAKKTAKKTTKKVTKKATAKKATAKKATAKKATVERHDFQASTRKLLDLMIHSVYSHKEVFLRELISNASDAIDKVRFLALTDDDLAKGDHDYQVQLIVDDVKRTLTVRDNGVGMNRQEVIENLGTIARSGTEAFLEQMGQGAEAASPDLIGRFGVGFYSCFMVANQVDVVTYKQGEAKAVHWTSTGDGAYTLEDAKPTARGTSVTLTLKPTAERVEGEGPAPGTVEQDFANQHVVQEIVKKHSDFVSFPIVMDVDSYESERDADGKIVEGGTVEKKTERKTLNSMKALWTRSKSEIEDSEYDDFYRHVTRDWGKPFDRLHVKVEGMQEYTALMYLPEKAPYDLFTRESRRGLQLYVKHVFIMDECRELMPEYLRFVQGLVDSPDLPLNVSRETVQHDRVIAAMRKTLTKKWLTRFQELLDGERERYETLWGEFGQAIKEGFHYEPKNKEKLEKLLLLRSTHGNGWTTLAEYVERAPEGQDRVYYLAGDKLETLRESPQLEVFASKGVEVLLFSDPIDEIMVEHLPEFDGKALQSVSRGEVDLSSVGKKSDDDGDSKAEDKTKDIAEERPELEALLAALGRELAEEVGEVRLSSRLTGSAACLVTPEGAMSPQIERMMAAMGQAAPPTKRLLELNPDHTLIQKLAAVHSDDPDDDRVAEYGRMLYDQALLSEGGQPTNPARFARHIAEVMAAAL